MLQASWEQYATEFANAATDKDLVESAKTVIDKCSIDVSVPASVIYGWDTRPSCPALVSSLEHGLSSAGAQAHSAGLVTTPQLHYLVRATNTVGQADAYGEPTLEGYYKKLAAAWQQVNVSTAPLASKVLAR